MCTEKVFKRLPVFMAMSEHGIVALSSDGAMWAFNNATQEWTQIPDLPPVAPLERAPAAAESPASPAPGDTTDHATPGSGEPGDPGAEAPRVPIDPARRQS